jgi:hypothetical protein
MIPNILQKKDHKKVETRIYKVTPQMAEELLKMNIQNNRTPVKKLYYAGIMARNEWVLTGETIKFDELGRLVDGQNRLYAIVHSKTPQELEFRFNLDPDVFKYIDSVKTRTLGDRLKTSGYINTNQIAAVITKVMGIDSNTTFTNDRKTIKTNSRNRNTQTSLSDKERMDLLNTKYKGIDELVHNYITRYTNYRRLHDPLKLSTIMSYAYTINKDTALTESEVDKFFEKLILGEGLQKDDNVFMLRNYLQANAGKKDNVTGQFELNEMKATKLMLLCIKDSMIGKQWKQVPNRLEKSIEEIYEQLKKELQ